MKSSPEGALPKVAVIIVNWNGEKFLERCLTALSQQTVAPHEVILVDNASSDSSLDIARDFSFVKLLPQSENLGFARGNNLAIKQVSTESEWVALLNPDAFADRHWLESLLDAAVKYKEFDVFGSKLVNAENPSLLDGVGDVYHLSGLAWRKGHGALDAHDIESPSEIFSPCAAAAIYRLSALMEVGGLDEDYFCYVEDVDLGFRLRLAGYRCLYVPTSIVQHVGSGTTGGKHSDFSVYHGHRNLVWTYIKDMPEILFWGFLPLHLLLNLVTVIYFVVRGQGKIISRSKWDAIKGIPSAWRKRRATQLRRKATVLDIWRLLDKRIIPIRRANFWRR